jgi:hypothetical protein
MLGPIPISSSEAFVRYVYPVSFLLVLAGFVWAFIGLPDGRILFTGAAVMTLATLRSV